MDWLVSTDFSHLWNWIIAQTPTPNPTSSPLSIPASNINEIELLKSQLEFLKVTNGQLSESFNHFVTTMQFVLVVFGFLGGVLAFIFGKNLDDAKKVASQMVRQEIDSQIADLVKAEIQHLKRTLQRERVIGSTILDYYLPSDDEEPNDCKLLRQRGFQEVRFWNHTRQPNKPVRDIFVLDLINSQLLTGSNDPENKQEAKVKAQLDYVLKWLETTTVLVIYVKGRYKEIENLATRCNHFYVSANAFVSLMGIVADSAYVAYGEKHID